MDDMLCLNSYLYQICLTHLIDYSGEAHDEEYHGGNSYNMDHRTPSPGHPLNHGYQLEDGPYQPQAGHMEMPMGSHSGDVLQAQPTVSQCKEICARNTDMILKVLSDEHQ